MAWNDNKSSGDDILSADWDAMVADQQGKSIIFGGNTGEKQWNNGFSGYFTINGGNVADEYAHATESFADIIMPKAGWLSNMYTYVATNAINAGSSIVFTVRKNGVDTGMTTKYDATTTGSQINVGSVEVAVGDLLNMLVETANDGGATASSLSWGLEFK